MVNEKNTDLFISRLLDSANIEFTPNGSSIKEIEDALKTASKRGTKKVGFPEFVGKSKDFIIVIEDKAETNKQALYCEKNPNRLDLRVNALTDYAENGALHYAQHIINNTNFKKIFAFGCSGDEKHHIIRPIYVDENNYTLLDEVENFENFNEANIEQYYKEIVLNETPAEVIEIEEVLEKSKELNELLTSRGSLTDTEKPLVVSAILLALNENADIDQLLKADEIKHSPSLFFEQFEGIQNKPIIQISNKNYNQQSKTTSSKSSYLYQYTHKLTHN